MLNKESTAQIEQFQLKLSRRQLCGAFQVTAETAKLYRNIIAGCKWMDFDELYHLIGHVRKMIEGLQPIEFAVESTALRILNIISEEERLYDGESEETGSLRETVRSLVLEGIAEMLDEIETSAPNIANQALQHIHSSEIILTVGYSKIVAGFLKEAARVRKFQVMVVETSPNFEGQSLAIELSKSGIETTLLSDCSVFAVMSRVNKVIIGAHAITRNGGVVAITGSRIVSMAASIHSTPVVVCASLHSMTPELILKSSWERFHSISPDGNFRFENGQQTKNIQIPSPAFDFIEPELISLFITNIGPHPTSEIERLTSESFKIK